MAGGVSRRRLLAGAAGVAGAVVVGPGTEAVAAGPATTLPSRADILAVARRVNDAWINANADPGNNQWARSVYHTCNMAFYQATSEPRYLAYSQKWAEQNNYGIHDGNATRVADDQVAGQAYYALYDVQADPARIANINASVRGMVHGTSQTTKVDDWWWVDALNMGMPIFVRVGQNQKDDAYVQKMWALYQNTKKTRVLYDYTNELWWRDGGQKTAKSPSGKPVFWSRGNGWAITAHARVLGLQADLGTRFPELRYNIQGLGRSLLKSQRTDGFWNVNLVDPNHFGGPETSGTAYHAFGLAYGIRTGIIDSATYLPVVAKAWNGLVATAVHADGFLGYVQGEGYAPESSQPVTTNSTADFGVGGFLLAATEIAKLAG